MDVNTFLHPGTGKSDYLFVEDADTCFNFNKFLDNPSISSIKNRTTEIDNIDSKVDIKIYPNPVKDYINIETNEVIYKSEVYNIAGNLLKSNNSSSKNIDITTLPIGNYVMKIYLKNKIESIKFIKN